MEAFDFVIVGGGSAGSVIAHQLAESGASVCVLEAGPPDTNPFIHMPAGFVKTLFNPAITWPLTTEPTHWTGGRRISTTQGRTLGGSSSINGMVYIRGQSHDFDDWAARGNRGWTYAEVLPYFKQLERRVGAGDDRYRGRTGKLPITDPSWTHPLCDAFVAGAASLGIPRDVDYNGPVTEGTNHYQRAIEGERRISAARAFLYPTMKRANLTVRTHAHTTSIVLDGKRAVGVKYLSGGAGGTAREVRANREVIVTAGALNSPKLLQLSGIGPAAHLTDLGIDVRHALAGVGENLSDHYSPRIVARVKNSATINNLVHGPRLVPELVKWIFRRPSILGLSAALMHAFGKSDPSMSRPDCTVIFTPASYREGRLGELDTFAGMTSGAWQMRPESKGFVRIASKDPLAAPLIQPNYLYEEKDRRVLLAAIRLARKILATPQLAHYYESEMFPGVNVQSDSELLDFARQYGSSCYHLVGACRMGPASDPTAVVDDELRVRGIERLRVADSSVMPTVTSGNTYAPTLMIARKAADLILGRAAPAAIGETAPTQARSAMPEVV